MSRPKLNKDITATAKELIILNIAVGISLRKIVDENNLPSLPTIYNWLNENHVDYDETFFNQYVRAREQQAEFYADEIMEIADTSEDLNRAKLQIDARKWKAGKMKPKVYGDRVINDNNNYNKNVEMTKEEMEAELKELKKRLS